MAGILWSLLLWDLHCRQFGLYCSDLPWLRRPTHEWWVLLQLHLVAPDLWCFMFNTGSTAVVIWRYCEILQKYCSWHKSLKIVYSLQMEKWSSLWGGMGKMKLNDPRRWKILWYESTERLLFLTCNIWVVWLSGTRFLHCWMLLMRRKRKMPWWMMPLVSFYIFSLLIVLSHSVLCI